MIDNTKIMQHFRSDEIGFVEQAQGWIRQVNDEYRPVLTHFLNPRERLIAESLVNSELDIQHTSFGGIDGAEMQRMLIYPSYHVVKKDDFELQALQISYPTKFAEIKHYQILGTLANQGIDRKIFGDIIGNDGQWQVIVENKMVDYLVTQVNHIGKIKIQLTPIELTLLNQADDEWQEITTTVTSFRLDTVVANCFNISRSKIKTAIEGGQIRINWQEINKPDYELAVEDVISVRGFGRLKITQFNGVTKKSKLKVTAVIIQNNKK